MGELQGHWNSWGYVEGMGNVSASIATAAQSFGAEISLQKE